MKLFLQLLILIPILSCRGVGAAPLFVKSTVFPAGLDGIPQYRIPGMVVTAKGTVLAYAEARREVRSDWGEIEVRLRRSTDGGQTWSAAQHLAHRGERILTNPTNRPGGAQEQTVNNPVAIVDGQAGAVQFLYCVNYARCFSLQSTDDGLTWSNPVEITATFEAFRKEHDWQVIATGPGHGIPLRSGRLVVPIWLAYGKAGAHIPSAAGTIYSDDHGQSWQAGELCLPNEEPFGVPNETALAELSDGRTLLVSRNVSQPNRKLLTTSPDGATHWTRPTFHQQLWEPVCMASLLAVPAQPSTLIFAAPNTVAAQPTGRGRRENLSLKLSRDDGLTWPLTRTLEAGPSAYSDLAALPDGTLLCLYEAGRDLRLAHFNLEWLESPPEAWQKLPPPPDPAGAAVP